MAASGQSCPPQPGRCEIATGIGLCRWAAGRAGKLAGLVGIGGAGHTALGVCPPDLARPIWSDVHAGDPTSICDAQAETELLARIAGLGTEGRRLIAIAGPPGAGKSTLAAALSARLNAARVVPMDGLHLDNAELDRLGLRARKGAPETFDAEGVVALVRRLREPGRVAIPLFDRAADRVLHRAAEVAEAERILLVEGNYLLLDRPPWGELAGLFDLTVMLEVPEPILRRRLVQRWLDHGLSPEAALARAESNDLVNARLVRAGSRVGDMVLREGG